MNEWNGMRWEWEAVGRGEEKRREVRRGEEARGEERREHHFKAHQRSTLPGARPGGQGFLRALAVVLTCNHTNDSGQSIACELKHDSMFGSKVASCPWCSAVCPRATTTMRRSSPLPASSISSRCSGLVPSPPPSSLAHSFIPPFIHSFGELKKELVFRNPPPIRTSSEWGATIDRHGEVPPPLPASPTDTPARWRNKKPGLPTDGDNPILQLEPSSSPRIGTRSSSSSWLTLARSMPTQQVIINKRLTNERARAQRSDGPMK